LFGYWHRVCSGIAEFLTTKSIELLKERSNVVAVYRKDVESANKFEYDASDLGGKLTLLQADITLPDDRQKIIDYTLRNYASVYGLVNNAGVELQADEADCPGIETMVSLNSIAPVELIHLISKHMDTNVGGSIVNILSVKKDVYIPSGEELDMASVHYGASKAYLESAMRGMTELRYRNIRINSVSPGPTIGGGNSRSSQVHEERFKRRQYGMNRRATINDVANAVLFLLSPISSQVVGHTIDLSGGQSIAPFYYPQ